MDADALKRAEAADFTRRCTQNGGLLVVRKGYLVHERYFGRAGRDVNPDMASTGKAYTSIACGLMLEEFRERIPEGLNTKVFTKRIPARGAAARRSAPGGHHARTPPVHVGRLLRRGRLTTAVAEGRVIPLKAVPGQNVP
ncbi:MAG UNVERIFIED_CONTAM: hypothetical protein LVR18_37580 [Planctomycetaceae bacterium]